MNSNIFQKDIAVEAPPNCGTLFPQLDSFANRAFLDDQVCSYYLIWHHQYHPTQCQGCMQDAGLERPSEKYVSVL
jgi:hypothetical protein